MSTETDALLPRVSSPETSHLHGHQADDSGNPGYTDAYGESFDRVPKQKRQLGVASAVLLIFNRVIGTGIYATPSSILRSAGSVGLTFVLWLVGALIAAAGTAVYIEFGTGLPRSGGEKNYLEYIYRRPAFLTTCAYAIYALITGTGSANSTVFGEYLLNALDLAPTPARTRVAAVSVLTFCVLIHGTALKTGLRLQNALGLFKLVILFSIALMGIFVLIGVPGFGLREGYEKPDNLRWSVMWKGSESVTANAFTAGLFNVIWSFIGYNNMNYALSEVRDPVRTIKRAAPIAMMCVTLVYILINLAYFAVVSKSDIIGSRRIIAALFFRNLFGPSAERALSAFIALSTLGNLLAGQFAQGRLIQELGREGSVFPFSSFFSSNAPFNAPLAGLFTQYLISLLFLTAPPASDVYLFMINVSSYSTTLINVLISGGLLALYTPLLRSYDWSPPFRAPKIIVLLFFASNIFLVIVPFVPPSEGRPPIYEQLPYWLHPTVAICASFIGISYWYIWARWLPRKRGYSLIREHVVHPDGVSRQFIRKVYH